MVQCDASSVSMRCLIVDDSDSFLRASRALLEGNGIDVVGVAATAAEGLQRALELQPDVTLVDIDLGEDSGFELARRLADGAGPDRPRVILVSTHPEDDFADLIAESPALGFIAKSELSASAV